MKSTFYVLLLGLFVTTTPINAQFFAEGGFDIAYTPFSETNNLISRFNERENHSLPNINTMQGYHFGIGKYGDFTMISIGFGNVIKKQVSKNPALLKESVDFVVNNSALDVAFGIKPFKKQFHSFGASLRMEQFRYRYSFGGDYVVPLSRYGISGEFFVDFAFKFRFLIKKDLREKNFYIFRIHPYYQLSQKIDLHNMEASFNQNASVDFGTYMQALNHFGLRLSLTVPFLNKDEQEKYKLGGTADMEKLRLRQEKELKKQNKKHSPDVPRGRL